MQRKNNSTIKEKKQQDINLNNNKKEKNLVISKISLEKEENKINDDIKAKTLELEIDLDKN